MKAQLIPVYFKSGMDDDFNEQVKILKNLLSEVAVILEPVSLDSKLPAADAVIFPQLSGDAFKQINVIKKLNLPFLVATSEFGTVNMWDWEIVSFMKSEGLKVFAPYNINLTKNICRGLALKREMKKTKFLVYRDSTTTGDMFPHIFKRFYWWEDKHVDLMKDRFGISLIKKSFKELGAQAKNPGW